MTFHQEKNNPQCACAARVKATYATYCLWAAPSATRPVHVGDTSHISSGLGGHIGRTRSLMVRRVASLGPVARRLGCRDPRCGLMSEVCFSISFVGFLVCVITASTKLYLRNLLLVGRAISCPRGGCESYNNNNNDKQQCTMYTSQPYGKVAVPTYTT